MSLSWPARIVIGLGVLLLVFVCMFPFLWMALSSVKTLSELYTVPPSWIVPVQFPVSPFELPLSEPGYALIAPGFRSSTGTPLGSDWIGER